MSATRLFDTDADERVEVAGAGHRSTGDAAAARAAAPARPSFDALYQDHFRFVWRCVRRLGVPESRADDACQNVYLVVHRRLDAYEPTASPRAWLFAIARRVAADDRRTAQRKGGGELPSDLPTGPSSDPCITAMRSQAAGIVTRFLETLPEVQREAFILSDLEEMTAPEVSEALGVNVSTVYSRVQAARHALERYVRRHHPDALRSPVARGGHRG